MFRSFFAVMAILSLGFMLFACSGEENIPEKASKKVDTVTTETAHKITKKIKTPINKAKMTKNLGNDRMEAMDKALQKQ